MDKTKIVLAVAVIFLLSGFLLYSFVTDTSESVDEPRVEANVTTLLSAQTNEEGPVSVSIQPLMTSVDTKDSWKFEVTLSTHSVDLTNDVTESIVLIDGSGNEHRPTSWEGDPPGGHHREGVAIFNPIDTPLDSIVLLARDIGSVSERKFEWLTNY